MRLIQVAQQAHDLQRAAEFYSLLLGVQPAAVYDTPGLLFFDLEGVRLLLERGAPSSVLFLEVEDVRTSISVLQGRGVEVVALPKVVFHHGDAALGPAGTDEWMAFIRDSEGNTVGLVSRHPPAVVPGAAPD
ncbi:VOC family protein [Pseudarthrobacter cellobiosi]|uniref:VOC family protein n=1 Tax=Pseudarthrobacter cellobiosi TaxID=2953654 RepID=UPI00208FE3AF|nr:MULTISPECIES: methylmalonyl-CoA epimerase [unclassified Pseudarthrobacter]MCO4255679.1 methylmalonyl-CoA epimerase [Pseudarthrobacter sp. HLT1-5]MCO4274041.1 methylmalonyl-CoA epimerase [Pseudarthrobacter sp. HLT3-5]